MSDYTPTRWHIRELWINNRPDGVTEKEAHNGFCTWLAEECAFAWDDGFDKGEEDAMDNLSNEHHDCTPNPYRENT